MLKVNEKTELRIPCEVYSRIVGYLRPIDTWNDGKRQEYEERVPFNPPKNEVEQALNERTELAEALAFHGAMGGYSLDDFVSGVMAKRVVFDPQKVRDGTQDNRGVCCRSI